MAIHQTSDNNDALTLIHVTVVEGGRTACLVAEVADWGAGGQTLSAGDVRALARS